MRRDLDRHALVVIDVQQGFADADYWGPRNNPSCEDNIAGLVSFWVERGRPVVIVRHASSDPRSPLHPDSPGHALASFLTDVGPSLSVVKSVNSAFHGAPDLDAWLTEHDVAGIVICGITTNHCCETTARVGGNLGHEVLFAVDATHTFDRRGPDGRVMAAEELSRATATNLHGEFATIVTTATLLQREF